MPFAGFKTFDACVAAQKKKGKSDASARKICGKLQADAEKKGKKSLAVIGPASPPGPDAWSIPKKYPFGEEVPEGGSSCASCYFLSDDRAHCRNRRYQEAIGTDELGAPAEKFCCMVWSETQK